MGGDSGSYDGPRSLWDAPDHWAGPHSLRAYRDSDRGLSSQYRKRPAM